MSDLQDVIEQANKLTEQQYAVDLAFAPYVRKWIDYLHGLGKWSHDRNEHPYDFVKLTQTCAIFRSPDNEQKILTISFYFMETGEVPKKTVEELEQTRSVSAGTDTTYGARVQANKNLSDEIISMIQLKIDYNEREDRMTYGDQSQVARDRRWKLSKETTSMRIAKLYVEGMLKDNSALDHEEFKRIIREDLDNSTLEQEFKKSLLLEIDYL